MLVEQETSTTANTSSVGKNDSTPPPTATADQAVAMAPPRAVPPVPIPRPQQPHSESSEVKHYWKPLEKFRQTDELAAVHARFGVDELQPKLAFSGLVIVLNVVQLILTLSFRVWQWQAVTSSSSKRTVAIIVLVIRILGSICCLTEFARVRHNFQRENALFVVHNKLLFPSLTLFQCHKLDIVVTFVLTLIHPLPAIEWLFHQPDETGLLIIVFASIFNCLYHLRLVYTRFMDMSGHVHPFFTVCRLEAMASKLVFLSHPMRNLAALAIVWLLSMFSTFLIGDYMLVHAKEDAKDVPDETTIRYYLYLLVDCITTVGYQQDHAKYLLDRLVVAMAAVGMLLLKLAFIIVLGKKLQFTPVEYYALDCIDKSQKRKEKVTLNQQIVGCATSYNHLYKCSTSWRSNSTSNSTSNRNSNSTSTSATDHKTTHHHTHVHANTNTNTNTRTRTRTRTTPDSPHSKLLLQTAHQLAAPNMFFFRKIGMRTPLENKLYQLVQKSRQLKRINHSDHRQIVNTTRLQYAMVFFTRQLGTSISHFHDHSTKLIHWRRHKGHHQHPHFQQQQQQHGHRHARPQQFASPQSFVDWQNQMDRHVQQLTACSMDMALKFKRLQDETVVDTHKAWRLRKNSSKKLVLC